MAVKIKVIPATYPVLSVVTTNTMADTNLIHTIASDNSNLGNEYFS